MKRIAALLPGSLVGRVFTLYAVVLLFFVSGGLGLFFHYRYAQELDEVQQRADLLLQVAAPTVADSAVIGDYDTIRRTLERTVQSPEFAAAAFLDVNGGQVRATDGARQPTHPPRWLQLMIARRMVDTNLPISVGGRDYGVVRLTFAHQRIAGTLWDQALYALLFAAGGLAGGLLLLRVPLGYWLHDLGRIRSFEESLRTGAAQPAEMFGKNAPIEFKQTFDVLNRAAASMQVQREQAAVTLSAIGDGVLTLDADGRVILANPASMLMLMREQAELLGTVAHTLLPQVFTGGTLPYAPWRARHCQITAGAGPARVIDSTLSAILGPAGEPHGYVLALRDVTEQHALDQRLRDELSARERAMTALRSVLEGLMPQAARDQATATADDLHAVTQLISHLVTRLQERGAQLNAIFDLSPDGFVSFDAQHRVNYVSPAFVRLTGLPEAHVLGTNEAQFGTLLSALCGSGRERLDDFDRLRRPPEGEEADEHHRRVLIELVRPTRRVLEVALRLSLAGGISQVLHLRDVTHETEVEQMKSEFLSTAAHELRTPMTSIFGFSELMMSRNLSPERQKNAVETIHRHTQLMISIVNELLDLARIEARRGKDFALEDIDLRTLTQQVVHDFKPPHQRDLPELQLPDGPVPVRVDRGKMAQALGNVLSNAYKYSPGGGAVEVRLVVNDATDVRHGPQVGIEVHDHGIGMTPEQLARACERFFRADTSGSIPGTGLGMSIVKEIVELLGGSLALASEPGQGTTVTLWLPRVVPAAPATDTLAAPVELAAV